MDSGTPEKNQVRVTIFNQTFSLRTSRGEAEARQLAETVDELMTSIAKRAGNLDTSRIALLACLHLADRLKSLEEDLDDLQKRVSSKSRDFSMRLDQALNTE